ncbi:hypothetical protein M514_26416 [Trichuris suis]|uniref:Uncharacterized protein n=1 Tax=Trichuris suis TaxID=68888 RepID=A0A085MW18_9BILA|nr:hypothetical protein M514_26416 [Trichuris suis]
MIFLFFSMQQGIRSESDGVPWIRISEMLRVNILCNVGFHLEKPQEDKYAAAPWLIGLFVFVVCGSEISSDRVLVLYLPFFL